MIAEHSFITTLEPDEALTAIAALLEPLRFTPDPLSTDTAPRWQRTPRTARQAKSWQHCPAQVNLQFDRGRIAAAIAISTEDRFNRQYRGYILALANSLELAATGREPPEQALTHPARHDQALRRRDVRAAIIVGSVLAIVLAMIGLLIYASITG